MTMNYFPKKLLKIKAAKKGNDARTSNIFRKPKYGSFWKVHFKRIQEIAKIYGLGR